MVLTLRAAVEADEEAMAAAARGALLGARGNSGVILSQWLRGLAEGARVRRWWTGCGCGPDWSGQRRWR